MPVASPTGTGFFGTPVMSAPKAPAAPTAPAAPATAPAPTAPAAPAATPPTPGASSYLTDPGYLAAVNSQTSGDASIDALLGKGLSQLLIGYGSPSLAAQLAQYGYALTPDDAAAAQANYNAGTGTLAQLDQANQLQQQKSVDALAAHGIADSGDLGYQLKQDATAYGNNVYNAEQNVLGQAFNLQQNALSQRQGLQSSVVTALQNAWNNFVANPGAYTQPAAPGSDSGGSTAGAPPATPAMLESAIAAAKGVNTPGAKTVYLTPSGVKKAVVAAVKPSKKQLAAVG